MYLLELLAGFFSDSKAGLNSEFSFLQEKLLNQG